MNKPSGFDEVKVGGDFTPIELGGHHAKIVSVKEQKSKTNRDMVVVALDFASNDKQAGYFKDLYDKDNRQDKKWPFNAVHYIVTEDNDGKCSRNFKGFITAFEDSNNTNVLWNDKFCEQFKGKKIGVVYGEVEEEYNGEVKTRRRIRWFCDDAKVDMQKIPEIKSLNNFSTSGTAEGFTSIDNVDADEIPF